MTAPDFRKLAKTIITMVRASGDPTADESVLASAFRRVYVRGYKDGVTAFAWWKDGDQLVGTCGRKLADSVTQG